jgi:hypothetical protein
VEPVVEQSDQTKASPRTSTLPPPRTSAGSLPPPRTSAGSLPPPRTSQPQNTAISTGGAEASDAEVSESAPDATKEVPDATNPVVAAQKPVLAQKPAVPGHKPTLPAHKPTIAAHKPHSQSSPTPSPDKAEGPTEVFEAESSAEPMPAEDAAPTRQVYQTVYAVGQVRRVRRVLPSHFSLSACLSSFLHLCIHPSAACC